MKLRLLTPLAILSILAFSSCGDTTDEADIGTEVPTIDTSAVVEVETESMEMDFMLPSPLQVAEILTNAGLEYNSSLPNDPNKSIIYITNTHKLLNFGSYSADLSYSLLNGQTQEALNYLKVLEGITDDLGLSVVFQTSDLINTFENNPDNQDSLVNVLVAVQERLDEYVDDNDERYMHTVIMTGAWVEFMYFGSNAMNNNNEATVSLHISEQMTLLENLIRGLSNNPGGDDRINSLLDLLNDLSNTYTTMESVTNQAEESDFPVLNSEEISQIGIKIEQIRKSIVEE